MERSFFKILGGVFLLLVLIKIFNVSYPLTIRVVNTTENSEFSVTGTGKVEVVPDVAVIDAGITVSNVGTAEEAKSQITTVNNKIINAVKALGVDKKDIETSGFNIYPEYSTQGIVRPIMLDQTTSAVAPSSETGNSSSKISGYNGTASVTIKVRNKDLASQVIQKVTDAGGTNVSGPRFTIDDRESYKEKARTLAIENAKSQAKKLEKELGIRLGKITNMYDESAIPYGGLGAGAGSFQMDTKMAEAPEFEEGTDSITSTVTLFFERK